MVDRKAVQSFATKPSRKASGHKREHDAEWCRKTYAAITPSEEVNTKTVIYGIESIKNNTLNTAPKERKPAALHMINHLQSSRFFLRAIFNVFIFYAFYAIYYDYFCLSLL